MSGIYNLWGGLPGNPHPGRLLPWPPIHSIWEVTSLGSPPLHSPIYSKWRWLPQKCSHAQQVEPVSTGSPSPPYTACGSARSGKLLPHTQHAIFVPDVLKPANIRGIKHWFWKSELTPASLYYIFYICRVEELILSHFCVLRVFWGQKEENCKSC